jgi:hypothetical protein
MLMHMPLGSPAESAGALYFKTGPPRLATQIVTYFLAEPEPTQKPATVVLIGGNECVADI